ncbi:unnamed protein product [Rotaria magnacalcarata]|uniref:PARP catalytic domain-containing protein n=2 Tax=Rotaria magnacalcarata TaxID=392030 RepID=A0A815V892_9BILA|nr:unnamed protein product [Rotaria magnacalcarata]CAF2048554.1 unnamed protein product [Rotaria magnacalcarata]
MPRTPCRYGAYCWCVGKDHWRKYDHSARRSRKIVRLFHGTSSENASGIERVGLQPSKKGHIGPGFYFTTQEHAQAIARYRGHGQHTYLLEVEVDLGNLKNKKAEEDDQDGRWRQKYDACTTIHPRWVDPQGHPVVDKPFREWCVKDHAKMTIVGRQQLDVNYQKGSGFQCHQVKHQQIIVIPG